MVTAQLAFERKNQLSVASVILEKETALISTIKPRLSGSLTRKRRIDRWQSRP
jgi:hypothetical protein